MNNFNSLFKTTAVQLPDNFIAAAVKLNEVGKAVHAGIFFAVNGERYLLHFYGDVCLEENHFEGWYVSKNFEVISPMVTFAFLTHCKLIADNSRPKFAFYFPGSFYANGEFYSSLQSLQYMTCVGFCLNAIGSFVEDGSYLNYEDWNLENIDLPKEFVDETIEILKKADPDADPAEILKGVRRITPDEYLASAFFKELPIGKNNVDEILGRLQDELVQIALNHLAA